MGRVVRLELTLFLIGGQVPSLLGDTRILPALSVLELAQVLVSTARH